MITQEQRNELYYAVINKFGRSAQTEKAIEELAELIQALGKYRGFCFQGRIDAAHCELDHIAEEMADVSIMLEQLKIIYNNEEAVEEWREKKLARLEEKLS